MDTAAKRFTAQLISLPFRGIATPPDNTTSAGDRVALAYQYSGLITVTTPSAGFIRLTAANIDIPYSDGSIDLPIADGSIQIP